MHVTFFSEAAPLRKTIGHQLSWMPAYREPACGNKADSLNAPALPRREVLAPGRCCLITSISSTHYWAIAGLVLFCSELSTVNRIPWDARVPSFSVLHRGFLHSSFQSFSLFLAQVQAHVPGSVALGPDPVGCAAITFPWAAIPKVRCLKHTRTHGLPSLLFALTLGIHSHHSRLHFGRDADSNSPGATSLWKVSCLHSHLCVFLSLFKAGCAVSYVGGNPSCAAVLRHCCWDKCSQAMSFTYLLWLLMLEWSWLLQELL